MPQKNENCDIIASEFEIVLQESIQVIKECFEHYDLDEVFLAFNGGKDCTVLLDILINYICDILKTPDKCKNLKVVYIKTQNPFMEIEHFVDVVSRHYVLNLMTVEGDMKFALKRILEKDKRLKACFMGTRRVDPHGANLNFMQETDASWPKVVRVSPLLNWSYHQIWAYILKRRVPYCKLYDKGYTSIGSTLNTWPNPALTQKDSSERILYLPAWKLQDPSQERAGRNVIGQNQNTLSEHEHEKHENGNTDSNGYTQSDENL